MWMLATGMAQAAGCPEQVSIEKLNILLGDAESAYGRMDDAYPQVSQKVVDALPCLSDMVPRETVARLHRELGLAELFAGHQAKAEQAFAAARLMESYYTFPEDLVPTGHPARAAYDALSTENAQFVSLPAPKDGTLRIDGDILLERPTGWPSFFQQIDPTGHITQSAYLWPEDPAPSYPVSNGKTKSNSGGGGGSSPLAVMTGILSAGALGAGAALWATAGADYSSEICSDTSSPIYHGQWCNDAVVPRVGIGRVLTIAGGIGLAGSSVWLIVSPGQVGVGGTF